MNAFVYYNNWLYFIVIKKHLTTFFKRDKGRPAFFSTPPLESVAEMAKKYVPQHPPAIITNDLYLAAFYLTKNFEMYCSLPFLTSAM
jgi:hypothetical protein